MATKQATFANLKIKPDNTYKTFEFNDVTVKVRQYITASEKADLVDITIQKSEIDGLYHPILLIAYTALNIVYLYTDISFTEKQREDELKLYDALYSTGVLDKIIELIPKDELQTVQDCIEIRRHELTKNNGSISGALRTLAADLPQSLEEAKQKLEGFDLSQYKEALAFAQSTNNGNAIPLEQS